MKRKAKLVKEYGEYYHYTKLGTTLLFLLLIFVFPTQILKFKLGLFPTFMMIGIIIGYIMMITGLIIFFREMKRLKKEYLLIL